MTNPNFTDPQHLRSVQYRDSSNLNARLALHENFSTSPMNWMRWVFNQFEFPKEAHILDLGCGPGTVWVENRERVLPTWQITMMDISEGMVVNAREDLGDQTHKYGCVNAQHLPFPGNTFDIVIANHMLYHVPDFQRAVLEITRVLKTGGLFYAATNGPFHMTELFELINDFAPEINYQGPGLSFDLENGEEQLVPWFETVEKREQPNSLKITKAKSLADYIKSMWFRQLRKRR